MSSTTFEYHANAIKKARAGYFNLSNIRSAIYLAVQHGYHPDSFEIPSILEPSILYTFVQNEANGTLFKMLSIAMFIVKTTLCRQFTVMVKIKS
jgi:hypothetical protein